MSGIAKSRMSAGLKRETGEALEEYGATQEQAEAAEDAVIAEFTADRKAGRAFQFKGKLTA